MMLEAHYVALLRLTPPQKLWRSWQRNKSNSTRSWYEDVSERVRDCVGRGGGEHSQFALPLVPPYWCNYPRLSISKFLSKGLGLNAWLKKRALPCVWDTLLSGPVVVRLEGRVRLLLPHQPRRHPGRMSLRVRHPYIRHILLAGHIYKDFFENNSLTERFLSIGTRREV